jgi:hypothetical protein
MSDFVEMLQQRLEDAGRRLQESQVALQQAQAKHQAVAQEFGSLQTLIGIENTKVQRAAQEAALAAQVRASLGPRPLTHPAPASGAQPTQAQPIAVSGIVVSPETNKTEMIREVLRQHTNGITPAQVWMNVKDKVERNYVYSVLKRMKDKDEVKERRGKYYLQVASEKESGEGGQAIN